MIAGLRTDQTTLQLLVVEDDPVANQFLTETLENSFGHRVVGNATSGPEMVRMALTLQPDVVVFDIHLPHLNGLDALHQIYDQRITAAVAITADRDLDLIRRASEEHVLAYLVKPVEPYQLGAATLVAWTRFQELASLTEAKTSLEQTLQSRKLIERAKGVLMKRHRWSEDEAFRRLQRSAMNYRRAMVDLAKDILNGIDVNI
jgi:response regulator NasT